MKYNVIWSERHILVVEAKNKAEAVEKAMKNKAINDEDTGIYSPPEAFELKE